MSRRARRFLQPPAPDAIFGADLKLYLRSDFSIIQGGGVMSDWINSGIGPSAEQSNVNYRPGVTTSDPHFDEHRTFDFDGANDSLYPSSSIYGTSTSDWLCWVVFDADSEDSNPQALFDCFTSGGDRLVLCHQSGPGTGNVSYYEGGSWKEIAPAKRGAQVLVFDLRSGIGGGSGNAKVYRDGVQIGPADVYYSGAASLGGAGGTRIGAIFDGTNWFFDGSIAEIGIARNPSDAYRDALHAYLAHRYPLLFQQKVDAVEALSHVTALHLADRGVVISSGVADQWEENGFDTTSFQQTGASRPTVEPNGFGTGRPTLLFDGADDYMSAGQYDEWSTISSGYVYVLYEPITFAVADPNPNYYIADPIWATSGGYCGLGFYQSANVVAYNYDGNYDVRTAATSTGRQIVRWRHAGGNLYLRVNNGAETAGVASGDMGNFTAINRIGANPGATGNFAHMRVGAIVAGNNGALSGADDAAIMAMLNAY